MLRLELFNSQACTRNSGNERTSRADESSDRIIDRLEARFSLRLLSLCLSCQVSAYCTDNSNLRDWSCASCNQFGPFTVTGIMDDTANQGYVGYFTQGLPSAPIPGTSASDPFVLVSMRGTVPSDLEDWIEDLSFSKFSAFNGDSNVQVHSGFWESSVHNHEKRKGAKRNFEDPSSSATPNARATLNSRCVLLALSVSPCPRCAATKP